MVKNVIKFIVGALWGRVVLWWTKRQLAKAQTEHQLAVQKFDSLQTGVHIESVVEDAGNQVVVAAAQMSTIQQQLEELQRRADERAKQGGGK